MVTKLRSISTNVITKIISFALCVILITTILFKILYVDYLNYDLEAIIIKDYKATEEFENFIINSFQKVFFLGKYYNEQDLLKDGIDYYINIGDVTYTNIDMSIEALIEEQAEYTYIYKDDIWYFPKDTSSYIMNNLNINYFDDSVNNQDNALSMCIRFSDDLLSSKQVEWTKNREVLIPQIIYILIYVVLLILLVIHLICTTGRRSGDREIHLSKLDKIYSDILLSIFIIAISLWLHCIYIPYYYWEDFYVMVGIGLVTVSVSILCGVVLLSLVRKYKATSLIKHSLFYIIIQKTYRTIVAFINYLFNGSMFRKYALTKALFYRQLIFIVTSAVIACFTCVLILEETVLFLIPPILELFVVYWYIKGNRILYNDINRGFNDSLEEQMKAERMKVALITNVSHDLKTPLTSIISYIELLDKEEALPDTAVDYVKVLKDKSQRLNTIVSDLFDLAKSTSGAIKLDLEKIDLKKLIEQTLGDMEDKISKSDVNIKLKLTDAPVYIYADGKRMYRVFQNTIDNALKYSLCGTRIFIELDIIEDKVLAVIKNVAGYEMDFTASDILERFTRGDKSRTTEGSGLGLSIADSFTRVCGGDFKVDIDGDMFKVTISFRISS